MATWVLSGVDLDSHVAASSGEAVPDLVGGDRPTFGGDLRADVADRKRAWECSTVPSLGEVAEAIRRMVDGQVDSWSFESDLYSARGLAATAGAAVVGTALPKHGGKGLTDGGVRLTHAEWARALPAGCPWTVMLWRADGPFASTLNRHWISTSAGGLWLDGAATAVPACALVDADGTFTIKSRDRHGGYSNWNAASLFNAGTRISVVVSGASYVFLAGPGGTSGGSAPTWPTTHGATVGDGAGALVWTNEGRCLLADDAVLMPFVIPSAWVAQLYAEHSARPSVAPLLRMTGDAASVAGSAVLVRGASSSGRGALHQRSGATQRDGKVVEFRLLEVQRE